MPASSSTSRTKPSPRLYLLLLALALALVAACKEEPVPGVCCTTDADCARLGGISPRGCPDGFACRDLRCEAADCAAAADCTADRPACDPDRATCTGCMASTDCAGYADAPVCDPATGGCRACALDAECASEVCDVDIGRCVDERDVIYASPGGADTAGCSHAQPCSVARALVVAAADPSPSLVRLLAGTYGTTLDISTGMPTIVGTGAVLQPLQTATDAIYVKSGAHVTVRGLMLDLSLNNGVVCDGAVARSSLNLLDLSIVAFQSGPIFTRCSGSMRRVRMTASDGAFVSVGPHVTLELDSVLIVSRLGLSAQSKGMVVNIVNSIFDGGSISFVPSDDMTSTSRMLLAFSTVSSKLSAGVSCGAGTRNALIENNVILSAGANALFGPCTTVSNNVVFPQADPLPASNRIEDPRLVDVPGHGLRLRADSPAVDAAVPSATLFPDHDFFGAPRPVGPRPDIGAHELAP